MASFAVEGTFTLTKSVGFIYVDGDPIEIIAGLEIEVVEDGPVYLIRLNDTRPLAEACFCRATIERTALRGGITRKHQPIARTAETSGVDLVGFGEDDGLPDLIMPEGEILQLKISAIGTQTAFMA